ncbi:hypothetical protein YDYSY3_02770 [Paenibacillus chitinolyticus]|uniref:hypothetical protein n=1 Tax=Paenibacillus chitinolyticus TaxID=79263 RepID=UPI0026E4D85F|nr:hypothetical protein [Paenibacillus chitinolyticus]GKS09277.1 hypothetical protein YDYSY3_02770 [Paenibacillus chitinolyticus]
MFEIKYRIIIDESYWKKMNLEQIEKEGGIEGFFQINLHSADYGYYHNRELAKEEEGFDIISTWLSNLLEVCLLIDDTKYVAIKDTESYNTWLEFISADNGLLVSVVQSDSLISEYVITKPLENRVYPEWRDIKANREKFIEEVVNKTKDFITDLSQINPLLSMSQRIVQLQLLLDKARW